MVVATYPNPILPQDIKQSKHVVEFQFTEINIAKWWNVGLRYIRKKYTDSYDSSNYEVLALSSDCIGKTYSVAKLGAFLREHNLAMAGPDYFTPTHRIFSGKERHVTTRVPGACWMVAGELDLRLDENFRWWFSDDDFEMQHRHIKSVGVVAGTGLVIGHDSELDDTRQLWAQEDRQRYFNKWSVQPW